MHRRKQETGEEKLCRQIRNVTATLEREPTLRSLRERRAELEQELRDMPLEKRQALVPWQETAREAKENIANEEISALIRARRQSAKDFSVKA